MKTSQYPPFWKDDRAKSEIQITGILAEKLSQMNHSRTKPSVEFKNQDIFFILIGGVPSIPNEFIGLKFPGRVLRYFPPFFDRQKAEDQLPKEEIEKKLFNVSMENTCQEISGLIEANGFKEAIFVYHSFGGSITAWFASKYPYKIKGLICLGGTPIRFYPIVKDYTKAYLSIPNITRELIIENYDIVYSLYDEKTKHLQNWTRFKSKEELLSFTLHNDPHTLNSLFDKVRSLPLPILMIYGDKDSVLTKNLCSEAMVYMCYLHKEVDSTSARVEDMKKRFCGGKGQLKEFNLQEKFVYFIEGGHSIHTSEKNNSIIQKLIDQYLYVLLGGQIQKNKTIQKQQNVMEMNPIKPKL